MAQRFQLEGRLASANRRLIMHARAHSRAYYLIAGAVFVGGMFVSAWVLALDWGSLELKWLLMNLFVGAPAAIALNAIGLRISANIVGVSLSFGAAFRTCCIAICSNLLPIPAGTLIQASSLASRGGSTLQSGIIILVGNALSLAIVLALVGAILLLVIPEAGIPLLLLGIALLATCSVFILKRSSVSTASAFIATRCLRTVVMVLRIQLSFMIIGFSVSALDAAVFSGALVVGTTLSVFPGGLGVSEALAALLALATAVAPGAAFLATALNRLATLAFAGMFLLILPSWPMEKGRNE
ncbi:MAG: hypothetical protein R6U98_18835 [Pirellulaceae bacterium]